MSPPNDILDRPLRDLRISVTDRCNLRCGYCMPAEIFGPDYPFLKKSQLLDFDEIIKLCRLFVQCGVEKIRLTGGEPLLRPGLADLIERLVDVDGVEDLALTTNGLNLSDCAEQLQASGLQRVSVSLDTLSKEVALRLNGRSDTVERALEGIFAAQKAGLETKVNAVVKRGLNDDEILPLARRFKGTGITLRFIEFMDVGNHNGWALEEVMSSKEILARLQGEFDLESLPKNYVGEVAQRYRYLDGSGEVGVVASVSQPFCGDCSRARLTADGNLVTCLFAKGGHCLRQPLREGMDDKGLLAIIRNVWMARKDRYSEQRNQVSEQLEQRAKVEMSYVGG